MFGVRQKVINNPKPGLEIANQFLKYEVSVRKPTPNDATNPWGTRA